MGDPNAELIAETNRTMLELMEIYPEPLQQALEGKSKNFITIVLRNGERYPTKSVSLDNGWLKIRVIDNSSLVNPDIDYLAYVRFEDISSIIANILGDG